MKVECVGGRSSGHTSAKWVGWGASVVGSVNSVGVVKVLGSSEVAGGVDVDIGVRLDNPDKFFARVVEVKFNFVAGGVDRFVTSELELFDQVFVGNLGEAAAFISVKVDVVNIE